MTKLNLLKLVVSIIMCQLAGIIGSFFTMKNIPSWYSYLNKPSFNPPNWVFGPVWTLLYLMMGISFFIVWAYHSQNPLYRPAITLFIIQLALNLLWSFLFFGLKNPLAGFIEILILWVAILITVIFFFRISKPASILLIPYLLWVSFAAVLNYYLYKLN
ncbi:tryptophan-rich sensory protein [candidate division WOR-3 bacterium]|nr:tryptophan-rich sensory protein [candidate division WOR-3 bacterium]